MTRQRSIYAGMWLLLPFLVFGSRDDWMAVARDWLPIRVGDRWTYEVQTLSGDRAHPKTEKWEQKDTTVAIQRIPQGFIIKRKVEVSSKTGLSQGSSDVLLRHSCLYYLNDSQRYGKNHSMGEWSAELLNEIAGGKVLPDVCLPLKTGKVWGDPKQPRGFWKVAGFGRKRTDDPPSVTSSAWRMEAHLASGDDDSMWFQRGIGLTAGRIYHNGTFGDYRVRLVSFEPGK